MDASQEMVADALPSTPVTEVGAEGAAAGVTGVEGLDAEEVPATFVAVTVKAYAVPFVRPVTAQEVDAVVQVKLPGVEVTV